MEDAENEGISTKKKVAAGAALGVAVPAAVAVGKKILGGDDSGDEPEQGQTSQRARRQTRGTRSTGRGSSKTAASARSSARRRTAKSKGSTGSRGGRTKEQLYTQAKRLKIKGRSNMTKAQLQRAVARKSS